LSATPRNAWRPRRRLAAALAAAIVGGLLVLAIAPIADAHAVLESSSPRDGAVIAELPDRVTLAFDENVATPAFVNVVAPDGSNVATGDPAILDNTVTQAVDPPGEAGTYQMSYRVVSADGHPVSATLTFKVTSGRHVSPNDGAAADAADNDGSSHTGLVLTIVALAAIAAVAALLFGRRRGGA
jgi:copper resistance protein C